MFDDARKSTISITCAATRSLVRLRPKRLDFLSGDRVNEGEYLANVLAYADELEKRLWDLTIQIDFHGPCTCRETCCDTTDQIGICKRLPHA